MYYTNEETASLVMEEQGINLENEGSLHSEIKKWYALPGDRLEARVDNYIIDILRGGMLIEIQTANFGAMRKKLAALVKNHNVRLVYPIAQEKIIVRVDRLSGEEIGRRKSPKKSGVTGLFTELVRIPHLINEVNFSIEVLMVKLEEVWCEDGKGSWRRRGASIRDRRLVEVTDIYNFSGREDFLKLLPAGLCQPFTNKILARDMGIPLSQCQKMTYCLKKMGAIKEVGRKKEGILFETVVI